MLFRGALQNALGGVVNPWLAVAAVSVLFGLAHAVSLEYAVVAALLGAYMGALMLLSGNVIVPVAVHALFDFVALLFITRRPL